MLAYKVDISKCGAKLPENIAIEQSVLSVKFIRAMKSIVYTVAP